MTRGVWNKGLGTWDIYAAFTKVNDLEKPLRGFYLFVFGGVAGVSPAEGEAEKPQVLERGGDFPFLIFQYVM
jgi:hypothetical protein